ncbi:MAG: acetylornithine/succinylornithine family transaminase [Actinomycetota bacterium]
MADEPAVMPTYGRYPLTLVRGEGMRVYDEFGREYLDFAGGLGTMPLGHSHPGWLEAVYKQSDLLTMVSNLFFTHPQAELAARIAGAMDMGETQVFFGNSGAEANEAALKIVRKWGLPQGRTKIVALEGSFHGRTIATLAATGQPAKREKFEPLLDWFEFVPPEDAGALDGAIGEDAAAVLVEPVMGEGGVIPLSDEFLRAAREISESRGVLLVCDEVQSGIGRCGAWRASSLAGVTPDIATFAKGLGGGLPIGAAVARRELAFAAGEHASTFGGGPLVSAAALAVLSAIEEEHLLENAAVLGERIMGELRIGLEGQPLVSEVRGRGLMIGIDLLSPAAKEVVLALIDKGVLSTEASSNVVRLTPPLIVGEPDADTAIDAVVAAIAKVSEEVAG